VIEHNARPVADVRPVEAFRGCLLSESIPLAKAHAKELGYEPTLDSGFAADPDEIINSHRKPLNPRPHGIDPRFQLAHCKRASG
jgi:hypothetical protein